MTDHPTTEIDLPNMSPGRAGDTECEEKDNEQDRLPFALSSHFSFSSMPRLDSRNRNFTKTIAPQQTQTWINGHHQDHPTFTSSRPANENPVVALSFPLRNSYNLTSAIFESTHRNEESSFQNLLDLIGTCPSLIMDLSTTQDPRWMYSTLLPSLTSSSTASLEYDKVSDNSMKDYTCRQYPSHPNQQTDTTLHYLVDGYKDNNSLAILDESKCHHDPDEVKNHMPFLQQEQQNRKNHQYPIHSFNRQEITHPRGCSYPVSSSIISDTSFQISMTLWNTNIIHVLGILSDPNTFPLWYQPMIGSMVIITDEKGGSLSNPNSGSSEIRNDDTSTHDHGIKEREMHDGLWLEAITTRLIPPTTYLSLLYNCVATFRTCLGCPSSGTIQLFVERTRSQVGFTIGKFHGGIILSHSIVLHEGHDEGTVYLIDTVHVQHEAEEAEVHRHTHSSDSRGSDRLLFHRRNHPWFGFYAPSIHDFLSQTTCSFKSLGLLLFSRNNQSAESYDHNNSFIQNRNNLSSESSPMGLHSPLLDHVY